MLVWHERSRLFVRIALSRAEYEALGVFGALRYQDEHGCLFEVRLAKDNVKK